MKSKLLLLILALSFGAFGYAQKTVTLSPGDRVEVRAGDSESTSLSQTFLKDVVRALEILNRYAPEEYAESALLYATPSGMATFSSYPTRKTKADEIRDEVRSLRSRADAKKAEADKLEKEIEEVKWARGILKKLKDRLD